MQIHIAGLADSVPYLQGPEVAIKELMVGVVLQTSEAMVAAVSSPCGHQREAQPEHCMVWMTIREERPQDDSCEIIQEELQPMRVHAGHADWCREAMMLLVDHLVKLSIVEQTMCPIEDRLQSDRVHDEVQ